MDSFDLLIVGGGINGAALARDAAGRGLSVLLVEKDDLAAHTSSASSKLIHGGLRYLEQYHFRLVRESLRERAVMLRTAPHLVRPLRFVLPDPTGGRPWWMIRAGLFAYDLLAFGDSLPRSRGITPDGLGTTPVLKSGFRLATYWDACVDDARLVVLNAVDAAEHGAEIATRTELLAARREGDRWTAVLSGGRTVAADMIVNASGPWVTEILKRRLGTRSRSAARLVKGSHIVVPRLWQGDHAHILQQPDGRFVFALPYGEYSLIGTTDVPVARPQDAVISADEIDYLCAAVNLYFARQTKAADVVWSYSGIRSLYDDGSAQAKDVTREYRLELDDGPGALLLSVFGGKITTARALAERALDCLGMEGRKWTHMSPLPGGEAGTRLHSRPEWLPDALWERMSRAYGSRVVDVLGSVDTVAGLGRHFGGTLYETEVRYLVDREFARTADDVLWRRTKLGLHLSPGEQAGVRVYLGG